MKKVFLALLAILVLLLVSCGNSSTGGATAQKQPNCRQVPYEEQEEYTKTEYYTETVPYTDQECEDKELVYKKDITQCQQREDNFFSNDEPAKVSCTITNLDNEGGSFSIKLGFDVDGQKLVESQSKYIYPQSSGTFYLQKDVSSNGCYCWEEEIPTKQVCRDVIRYKDVQKSREVTAYRPVTKYREECN